jgi:hypothetical protein
MRNKKQTVYELLARRVKADKLADVIQGAGGTSAEAARMDDKDWSMAAALANVKPPGPETKRLVVEVLDAREDAARRVGSPDICPIAA